MEGDGQVIGFYPNKVTRKLLAVEWHTLNDEEKLHLKADRSRRGIRCDVCGLAGYFRENCPNACPSPPGTPDSLASTPPQSPRNAMPSAAFWGKKTTKPKFKQSVNRTEAALKKAVNTEDMRPQAMDNLSTLRDSDQKLGAFAFYKRADNAYATDYAQLTLHQVMRRIMRLLEMQLKKDSAALTASFDSTLLHPPMDSPGENFYPKKLESDKEYKDYFIARTLKNDRKLKYKNQAALRPVDDLDPLFRGGGLKDDFLYQTKPNAGESMHAKNTWKSILARHDTLANSDPALVAQQQELERLFVSQSQWISAQQKSMMFRNDRYEHMVHIIQQELKREHERCSRALEGKGKEERQRIVTIWTERLQSVDKLTNLLQSYKFTAGTEEADFLLYCLEKWREVGRKEIEKGGRENTGGERGGEKKGEKSSLKPNSKASDLIAASTNPYYPDSLFLEEVKKKEEARQRRSKVGGVYSAKEERERQQREQQEQLEKLQALSRTVSRGSSERSKEKEIARNVTIPPLEEMVEKAKREGEDFSAADRKREEMLKRYEQIKHRGEGGGEGEKEGGEARRKLHPKEKDRRGIMKMRKSFRMAGLGTRIRKGTDEDPAHALPALIPLPQAFDGDTKLSSHTADQITFQIKNKLILSNLGYIANKAVPLYVRTTLEEKEGTSLTGDPTKEELAQDRRYSHYVGRPLVRFNPAVTLPSRLQQNSQTLSTLSPSSIEEEKEEDEFALTTLAFPNQHSSLTKQKEKETLDKKLRKELKKAQEEVKHLPITNSLVRMVFTNPEPTLADLKYLDQDF